MIVHLSDLGDLRQVYRDYYLAMLDSIEKEEERTNVQQVIENELIYEPDERRIPCFEKVILDKGVSNTTLRWLVDEHHILRSEPNVGGGFTYELSHDVLVKPILAVKKVRLAEAEKIRLEKEKAEAEKTAKLAQAQAEKDRILREEAEEATKRARRFSIIAGTLAFVAVIALIGVAFSVQGQLKAIADANAAKEKAETATANVLTEKAKSDALLKKTDSLKVEADSSLVKAYFFELNLCKEQLELAKTNKESFSRLKVGILKELEQKKIDSLQKRSVAVKEMIEKVRSHK